MSALSLLTRTSARTTAAALLCLALVAGCRKGMSGTFEAPEGFASLEFSKGGKVYVTTFGGTFLGEYEIDGKRVIVKGPLGAQVFTREEAGLSDGAGTLYVKR